jgi:hypothetical protein
VSRKNDQILLQVRLHFAAAEFQPDLKLAAVSIGAIGEEA